MTKLSRDVIKMHLPAVSCTVIIRLYLGSTGTVRFSFQETEASFFIFTSDERIF
jgi:hypothetical protein